MEDNKEKMDKIYADVPTSIDTDDWEIWKEAKMTQEERKKIVKTMPLMWGPRHPRNLPEARILILYRTFKNGLAVKEDPFPYSFIFRSNFFI
jgi:hypothetical protein